MYDSMFCLFLCTSMTQHTYLPMLLRWSTGGGDAPRNTAMGRWKQERMQASEHECKECSFQAFKRAHLCLLMFCVEGNVFNIAFVRPQGYTQCVWWVTFKADVWYFYIFVLTARHTGYAWLKAVVMFAVGLLICHVLIFLHERMYWVPICGRFIQVTPIWKFALMFL